MTSNTVNLGVEVWYYSASPGTLLRTWSSSADVVMVNTITGNGIKIVSGVFFKVFILLFRDSLAAIAQDP